jgi:PAS domain S-box-containing protein
MRINLRLWHQGLILVGVPIGLMLIFVISLTFLLGQAELRAQEVDRSKTIISKANSLLKDYFDAGSQLLFFKYTKSENTRLRFEQHLSHSEENFKDLRELLKDDATEMPMLEALQASAEKGMTLLKDFEHRLQSREIISNLEATATYKQFNQAGIDFTSKMHELVNAETAKHQINEEEEEKSRALIKAFLVSGVIAALVVGALLVFFTRNTTGRLAKLMENTLLLSSNQPLLPQLEGDDEMARLDRSFHMMAKDLAEATRKERAILDNAVDVICSINAEGRFAAVNPASLSVWDYAPEDLIGLHYAEIIIKEDVPKFRSAIDQIKHNNELVMVENQVVTPTQERVHMLWSLRWSPEERSLFCVAHDITDRKRVEHLKQEFLAVISHELRTPLTSLQATLTLINTGMYGQLSESGEKRVRSAESSASRLIMLINDLLDIEKMEAGKLSMSYHDVNLVAIVENSIESVRGFAEDYDVTLKAEETKAIKVLADSDRLVQVLVNLLSNAIKFSKTGAQVEVKTVTNGDFTEVQVIDHGAGIPAGYEEKIFEKYEQVPTGKNNTKVKGTGLGLPICKAIIDQHGGTIGVRATEGGGSTFSFSIPRVGAGDGATVTV